MKSSSKMAPILRLDGVCKAFGGVIAAQDVCFEVAPHQIMGLIGPNGAGKTTILNLISGIYEVDQGSIYINEKDVTQVPAHKRAAMGLARTFQAPRFMYRSTIRDNLLLGTDCGNQMGYWRSFLGRKGFPFDEEIKLLMSIAGFTFDWSSDINSLPYGRRKLLEIVRSLLSHPKIMLVDEPAAGLNSKEIDRAIALLEYASQERGIGVVLIEHSMDMVMNVCHNIVVLNFGRVIAIGNPEEVSTNKDVIEAYLGRGSDAST